VRLPRSLSIALLAVTALVAGSAVAQATPSLRSQVSVGSQPAIHLPGRSTPDKQRPLGGVSTNPNTDNWAGYEVNGGIGAYTSVTSNWVQPYVPCASDDIVSLWVGLDGEQGPGINGTIEQTGTRVDCSGGSPHYYAWYEMFPNNQVVYGNPLGAGDNITATVTALADGQYDLYLRDITQNWVESTDVSPPEPTQNSSAEVVAEAPGNPPVPLADFGFLGFNGSAVNGQSLTAEGAQPIYMQDPEGGSATPSAINAAGYFTVNYGGTANIAGTPLIAYQASSPGNELVGTLTPPYSGGFMGQTIERNTTPSITALPGGGFEEAFQTIHNTLVVIGTEFSFNSQLGMAGNTSPSIAASPNGGFEVAFQANTGELWYFTPTGGGVPEGASMASGTSPSITALATGGYETAFQGSNGHLMEAGTTITWDADLGMRSGTSPAIASSASGTFQVAFQANTGYLYEQTMATGGVMQAYQMASSTSPAIAALSGGGYETAFQGTNGHLMEVGSIINWDADLGMMGSTNPGITGIPGNTFEVAFQANTGYLYTQTMAAGGLSTFVGMAGSNTSPAIAD